MAETGHDHDQRKMHHWEEVLSRGVLAEYLQGCRWFGGKAHTLNGMEVLEAIAVGDSGHLVLLRIDYLGAPAETYLLPLRLTSVDGAEVWMDALEDEKFRAELLKIILEERRLCCATGELVGICSVAFKARAKEMAEQLPSRVLSVEQSNSSVLHGDRFFLKLYRRPEVGGNPDVELLRYFTEQNTFEHVPGYCGAIEFQGAEGGPRVLALLVTNVPNAGTAWTTTLRRLERKNGMGETGPAMLLGERTAQMHLALAAGDGPEFTAEAFDDSYRESLRRMMAETTQRMMQLLELRMADLPRQIQAEAASLLRHEDEILQRYASLIDPEVGATRIRIHGDYHLGQVLDTEGDFVIIDFEGEPARPLHERRMKHSPLRDVAGMLRSFDYAAYTVIGRQSGDGADLLEWTERVCEAFLHAYLRTAHGAAFLPESEMQMRKLLDACLLEKAVYEVCYELNNRPDWAVIPLRGVLRILDESSAG